VPGSVCAMAVGERVFHFRRVTRQAEIGILIRRQ
jgi:hypothetical protein